MGKLRDSGQVCPKCNKTFKTQSIYNEPEKILKAHYSRCLAFQQEMQNLISKEFLEEHYVQQKKSLPQIKEELNLNSWSPIVKQLKFHNISTRSVSESALTEKKRVRVAKTNLERWGSPHNFCKDNPSRKRWEQRLLEEEGITNVFQREEIKQKIKETILEKYGVESSGSILTSRGKNSYSKLHKEVVEQLNKLHLSFLIEKKIEKKKGFYWAFDIFFEPDLLVEINGDYWHGNPRLYKATDLWLKGSSREQTMADRWQWDKEKIAAANQAGFKVLTVWEFDWKQDQKKELTRIQEFINENSKNQINQENSSEGSL